MSAGCIFHTFHAVSVFYFRCFLFGGRKGNDGFISVKYSPFKEYDERERTEANKTRGGKGLMNFEG